VQVRSEAVQGWITVVSSKGQALLEANGNTSSVPRKDLQLAILQLARAGDATRLRPLLEAAMPEFDLNCCDIRGRTPLMFATYSGCLDTVKCLLSHCNVHINALDDTQKTALHHLARQKWTTGLIDQQVEIVRELVSAGSMVDKLTTMGALRSCLLRPPASKRWSTHCSVLMPT